MNDLSPYFDQIRSLLPLSSVISRFIKIKRHGHEYQGCCPFHNENTPSFTINDQKGFYHCFGCGAHGDVISFVVDHQKIPFMEAVKRLAQEAGITLPTREAQETRHESILYKILEDSCLFFENQLKKSEFATNYLKSRDLSSDVITKYRLGYAHDSLSKYLSHKKYKTHDLMESGMVLKGNDGGLYDRFRDRLMIPICDKKGRVIAFGGRALLKDQQPKYLNSPETPTFHKGSTLYGMNTLGPVSKDNPLLVVEGYFDVIRAQIKGFHAVASLGTALTQDQIKILWRYTHLPVLCFDGDRAGEKAKMRAAHHALPFLKPGFSLSFMSLPTGYDPDSFLKKNSTEEFQNLIGKAHSLFDCLCFDYTLQLQNQTPEEKAKIKNNTLKLFDAIEDKEIKSFYKKDFYDYIYQKKIPNTNVTLGLQQPIAPHEDPVVLSQKILLVTLINHPILISVTLEQFVNIDFKMHDLHNLRDAIVAYAMDGENPSSWQKLNDNFKSMIDDLRQEALYTKAPFAKPTAPLAVAREGWFDVWRRYEHKKNIEKDVDHYQNHENGELSQADWNVIKQLYKDLNNL